MAGHPAATILASVLVPLLFERGARGGAAMIVVTSVAVVAVLAILVTQVRRSQWSDVDVSVREQRAAFYPIAIGISAAIVVAALLMHFPSRYLRGAAAALALILIGAIANSRLKLSLHCAFAFFAAVTMIPTSLAAAAAFAIFAIAVAWSRLALHRHTAAEVGAGSVLGMAAGRFTIFHF